MAAGTDQTEKTKFLIPSLMSLAFRTAYVDPEKSVVFLDRDGVINREAGQCVTGIDRFKIIPGSIEAISRLIDGGFPVTILTNQGWIELSVEKDHTEVEYEDGDEVDGNYVRRLQGKGIAVEVIAKLETLRKIHMLIVNRVDRKDKFKLTDIYFCPHPEEVGSDRTFCECRKPKPDLLTYVAGKYPDRQPLFFGDSKTDYLGAHNASQKLHEAFRDERTIVPVGIGFWREPVKIIVEGTAIEVKSGGKVAYARGSKRDEKALFGSWTDSGTDADVNVFFPTLEVAVDFLADGEKRFSSGKLKGPM